MEDETPKRWTRPWWWKIPPWLPGMETRRLDELEKANLQDLVTVNEQLRKLDEVLHSTQLDEIKLADLRARINAMQHFRTAILDVERSMGNRRQNLLLATTARATWAAAAVAVSPVAWEIAKRLLKLQ